jgi:hypothetical protein
MWWCCTPARVVESASAAELFARPRHPYTRGLLAARPPLDGGGGARMLLAAIEGTVPAPGALAARLWLFAALRVGHCTLPRGASCARSSGRRRRGAPRRLFREPLR